MSSRAFFNFAKKGAQTFVKQSMKSTSKKVNVVFDRAETSFGKVRNNVSLVLKNENMNNMASNFQRNMKNALRMNAASVTVCVPVMTASLLEFLRMQTALALADEDDDGTRRRRVLSFAWSV
ncbi:hypothetical protein WA158_007163 [Blastocystis sp. Blastoise]